MSVRLENIIVDTAPFVVGLLAILLVILWFRRYRLAYIMCFGVFCTYILFALDQTFFPLWIGGYFVDMRREASIISNINLVPFYFGRSSTLGDAFSTLMLNVLLTIPFGFGINFVTQIRPKQFLWLAPAVGFGIETLQLIISLLLGYAYRYIDINDVLMNALGVLIGYGIFRVFAWLYVLATQRFDIEHEGLTAYVYDVTSQAPAPTKPLNYKRS